MRKRGIYIFCLILFFTGTKLKAQNCWSPLGSGVDTILNRGNAHFDYGYVAALTTYKGNLIVGGTFDSIGGLPITNIAAWDGTSWSALGIGINKSTRYGDATEVITMTVYNGDLYVTGIFDSAGGIPVNDIAKWDGTSWSAGGPVMPLENVAYTYLITMAVYNGNLYIGGLFDSIAGLPAQNIAKWDGTTWSDVDRGIKTYGSNGIGCMMAYNNKLYVGGNFDSAGNIQATNIAAWNDTSWSALGPGIGSASYYISSIANYQGYIYAGGGYPSFNECILNKWDGVSWSNIAGSISDSGDIVTIFVFDNVMIVGGGFNNFAGISVNNLVQWDGTTWTSFGDGVGGAINPDVLGGIQVLNTYNGHLFAGGRFAQAGSTAANSIAEYTCATDGIDEITTNQVRVYPNPSNGSVNISMDKIEQGVSIDIYNLLGQDIFQTNLNSARTTIDLSGHSPGVYLYHISGANKENISSGTLIIE